MKICMKVKPCLFPAEFLDKLLIQRIMLGRKYCGGAFCNSAAHIFSFNKNIINARFLQFQRAQHAGHAAADYQHVGSFIAFQCRKAVGRYFSCPQKIHILLLRFK